MVKRAPECRIAASWWCARTCPAEPDDGDDVIADGPVVGRCEDPCSPPRFKLSLRVQFLKSNEMEWLRVPGTCANIFHGLRRIDNALESHGYGGRSGG